MSRLSTKQRRSARRRRAKYGMSWSLLMRIIKTYQSVLMAYGRASIHPNGKVTP